MSSVFYLRLRRSWGQLPLLLRGVILLLFVVVLAQLGILWHLRHRSQIRHKFALRAEVTYGKSVVPPVIERRAEKLVPHRNTRIFSPMETATLHQPADDKLESISEFRSLTELCIANGKLTDQGLAQIRHLDELQSLYLDNIRFDGDALSGLPTCANLQRLKLVGQLTPEVLRPLQHCLALTELHLDAGYYEHNDSGMLTKRLTGLHLDAVARIPNLKRLVLCSNDLSDIELGPLAAADQLEELFVNTVKLKGDALNALGQLPGLKRLSLEVTDASPQALQHLAGFPALQTLGLRGASVRSIHLTPLRKLNRLETLCLERADLRDSLEPLAQMRHLRSLNLFLAELPVDGLKQLERLDQLRELCLGFNDEMSRLPGKVRDQKYPNVANAESRFVDWNQRTEIPKWEGFTSSGGIGGGFF